MKIFLVIILIKFSTGEIFRFPTDFLFGGATGFENILSYRTLKFLICLASYQVEGAWNVDGKLESIWDHSTHRIPNNLADNSTGDVAANSYYFYEKDVEILEDVGFKVYRFSIAWTRVLTKILQPNPAGLDYYNKLIDALLRKNIQPMVTMYHWDLPQWIQDLGGWTNPKTVDFFVQYADLLYKTYGDRVTMWITFYEPSVFCKLGYGLGLVAPNIRTPKSYGFYICNHHVLLAHAKAYHLYREKYFNDQKGEVGINIHADYAYKMSENVTNEVVDRAMQFDFGLWGHPVYHGDYAPVIREFIDRKSAEEGRRWSRLPTFTQEEINLIKGSSDFISLNYYASILVNDLKYAPNSNLAESDDEIWSSAHSDWTRAKTPWINYAPEGLHDMLVWIKNNYSNTKVYITGNGWSDEPFELDDYDRIRYFNGHLSAVSKAINEQNCNVKMFMIWSLIDKFEWTAGFTERLGIFSIDFNDPNMPRTPKKSAQIFGDLTKTYSLETDWVYIKRP